MKGEATAESPWAEGAPDWADVYEGWNGWGVPIYRHIADATGIGPGTRVLDVGCGAGRFARLAADRGAEVCGIDSNAAFLDIARERVLDADFRLGEMEQLPCDDASFDVVVGFNSFFLADDVVAAMAEAARVARPGAPVATTVFGRPEQCDSTAMFAAVRELMGVGPDAGEGGAGPPPFHVPGRLEEVAQAAGLTVRESDYFPLVEQFADLDTIVRGASAPPPMRRAAAAVGEQRLRETLGGLFTRFTGDDGRVRLREEVRYLVATR